MYKLGASLSLFALGSIAGVNCSFTIDTGSDITIVCPDVLQRSRTILQPVTGHIKTVSGEMTQIRAKGVLEVSLGSWNMSQKIWVADVYDECILWMDFLQKHKCLVDLKKGILQINKEDNRTLETQLSLFMEDHQKDWDVYLPMLMMAYRTAIHDSTKCSPAKLMF